MYGTTSLANNKLKSTNGFRTLSIDDAIDLIGCGTFQNKILFAAGLCFASDSIEIMLLSFLSISLKSEWNLSSTSAASLVAVVFAGAFFGTLTLGPLGDIFGRKPAYMASAVLIAVFGFVTALAKNYVHLLVIRFIVGFGIGGLTAPFDLLLEVLPGRNRGTYLLLIELFWSAGSMFVPAMAWISLNDSWEIFVVLCALPCFLSVLVGWCLIPESPRWLVSRGRNYDALCILRQAAETNGKDPDELFPIDQVKLTYNEVEDVGFSELFKPKWRKIVFFLWAAWFGMAIAYYGTVMVITKVFEVSDDNGNDGDAPIFDYASIFLSSSAEVFGVMLVLPMVDQLGRINTQLVCYALGGFSLFIMCYFSSIPKVFISLFAFSARSFEMGASCVIWIGTPEMLSTEIRSTGHSTANAMKLFGGFVIPYIVEGDLSLSKIGIIIVVIHLGTMMSVYNLPETSGKTLGQIDSSGSNDHAPVLIENDMNALT